MHSFLHHHKGGSKETQGIVLNWGWYYDLLQWFFDPLLFGGKFRQFPHMVADLAHLKQGETVLDVGCGTGTVAIEVCKCVGETGHVYGIDPASRQIARARSKASRQCVTIDFQLGVIERLEFSDHMFDVVLSTFMMHHLPDALKQQGLIEILRVLKPGGRLLVVDFNQPEGRANRVAGMGAGDIGLQGLPDLLKRVGFSHAESGTTPIGKIRFSAAEIGFVRAQKNIKGKILS